MIETAFNKKKYDFYSDLSRTLFKNIQIITFMGVKENLSQQTQFINFDTVINLSLK